MISNSWFVRGVVFLRSFTGVGKIKIDKFFDFQTIGEKIFFFTIVYIRRKGLTNQLQPDPGTRSFKLFLIRVGWVTQSAEHNSVV